MLNVRIAGDYLYKKLAVAGDVYDGFFCAVLFPMRSLG